jgi:WhiB family redox-sensing transcriptional regulator
MREAVTAREYDWCSVALELGAGVYGEAPWAREPHSHEELLGRPPWMADAACAEHPELSFVPSRGEPTEPLKGVCRRCLVLDECLAYALADPDLQGVWGATSKRERDDFRRGVEGRPRRSVTAWSRSPTAEQRAQRALQRGASLRKA